MIRDWEKTFAEWAKPPGKSEEKRIESTINSIKNALAASPRLKAKNIKVFTQGSYKNRTNVREDSDVDIGIANNDTFFVYYPEGTSDQTFGNKSSDYTYSQFKNEVGEALVAYFGTHAVIRGNKAFDIKENQYLIEADVAPFFEFRHYHENGRFLKGVKLLPDNGTPPVVENWPDQHYDNGVSKNDETGRRFKSIVRILKKLCNEMAEAGTPNATNIAGFLIECLVWNVPNKHFATGAWYSDVSACLLFLFNQTKEECTAELWEVNNLKLLFPPDQKWTREHVNMFIVEACAYIGII